MARLAVLAAAAALTALPLAGCGGGSSVYQAAPTRSCLAASSADVSASDADYLAQAAPGGGYLVTLPSQDASSYRPVVTMSFYRSVDAGTAVSEYESFGGRLGVNLFRVRNAVLAWDAPPTAGERRIVEGCLRG